VILPTLVETVAQTLKLPYVAISLRRNGNFELAAEYGKPVSETLLLPLIYQSEPVGQLIVAPRSPDDPFSPADQALLGNIAHQAGPAVHAVRLTADLQRSRQRLVTAREEERRRLRRDLHDGLGPSLAALHLQMAVLRRLIYRDQEAAEAMIGEFRQDIRAAIDDIRQVVYELRPPALDQLGLVAALQAQASRYSLEAEAMPGKGEPSRDGPSNTGLSLSQDGLQVTVEAPQTLPALPAAVEVAAYRIVQEAMANVVHHAQAQRCAIRLELNGALEIEVVDDGAGLPPDYRPGVGLISMKERAEELGGKFAIQNLGRRGTRVSARLPLGEV
jgi:two-component system NarL family sensor kinase